MDQIITSSELKSLRQERGLSQAALARETGIQRSYLSQFENGKYLLTDDDQRKLAEVLESIAPIQNPLPQDDGGKQFDARLCDGFLVPGGISEEVVEELTETITMGLDRVETLAYEEVPSGFFGVSESDAASMRDSLCSEALDIVNALLELRGKAPIQFDHEGTVAGTLIRRGD